MVARALIIVMLVTATGGAAEPATRPADPPEVAAVRAAAIAAGKARYADDFEAFKATHVMVEDVGLRLQELWIQNRVARRRFREAVADRFGDAGRAYAEEHAKRFAPDATDEPEQINKAQITVDGDWAQVSVPWRESKPRTGLMAKLLGSGGSAWVHEFRKIDGKWKRVDTSGLVKGVKPEEAFEARQKRIARVNELATGVREGEYRTLEDAIDALGDIDAPPNSIKVPFEIVEPATKP